MIVIIGRGRVDRAVDAGVDAVVQVEADLVLDRGAVIRGPTRVELCIGAELMTLDHLLAAVRVGVPTDEGIAALGRRGGQALQHAGGVGLQSGGRGLIGKLAGVGVEGDGKGSTSHRRRHLVFGPLRVYRRVSKERITNVDRVAAGSSIEPARKGVAVQRRGLHGGCQGTVSVGDDAHGGVAVGEYAAAGIEGDGVGGRRHGILDAVLNGGLREAVVASQDVYVTPLAGAASIGHSTEHWRICGIDVTEGIGSHRAQLAGTASNGHVAQALATVEGAIPDSRELVGKADGDDCGILKCGTLYNFQTRGCINGYAV